MNTATSFLSLVTSIIFLTLALKSPAQTEPFLSNSIVDNNAPAPGEAPESAVVDDVFPDEPTPPSIKFVTIATAPDDDIFPSGPTAPPVAPGLLTFTGTLVTQPDDVFPDEQPSTPVSSSNSPARFADTMTDDVFPPEPAAETAEAVLLVFPAKDLVFPEGTSAAQTVASNPTSLRTANETTDDLFPEGAVAAVVMPTHTNALRVVDSEDTVFFITPGEGMPAAAATTGRSSIAIVSVPDDVFPDAASPATTSADVEQPITSASVTPPPVSPIVQTSPPQPSLPSSVVFTPPPAVKVDQKETNRPSFRGPKNRSLVPASSTED